MNKKLLDIAFNLSSQMFDDTAPGEIVMEHAKKLYKELLENEQATQFNATEDGSNEPYFSDSWRTE